MAWQLIQLDAIHQLLNQGAEWIIRKPAPEGGFILLAEWQGPRRTIARQLEDLGIVPSRDADARLERLPESTAFRDRSTVEP